MTSFPKRTTSGLDYLQRIVSGELPPIPIGVTLGFRLAEVDKGRVALVGTPDERVYNIIGTVHAGFAAAMLDSATALSTLSSLEADQAFTTVDLRVNYLRPLTAQTGEVRAEGRVVQGGRKLAYCEARLVDAAGKLICHATSSCLILPRE